MAAREGESTEREETGTHAENESGVERQKGRREAVAAGERWSAPAGEREAYGIAILSRCLSRALLAPRGRPHPHHPLFNELPRGLAGWLPRDVLCLLASAPPSPARARSPLLPALSLSASLSVPRALCVSSPREEPGAEARRGERRAYPKLWSRVSERASPTRGRHERDGVAAIRPANSCNAR